MSVVVGYKKDGVVYMGADTQVSYGKFARKHITDKDQKLFICNTTNLIIGSVGAANEGYLLREFIQTMPHLKDGILTKSRISEDIVRPFIEMLKKRDLLGMSDGLHDMNISFLIAKDDTLFHVENDGNILHCNYYAVIGSGSYAAHPYLKYGSGNPKDVMLTALRHAAAFDDYLSAPFKLTHTASLIMEDIKS